MRSSDKWAIYFKLEHEVTTKIRRYLNDRSIRHFFEHDGWISCNDIDTSDLKTYIKQETGYDLNFGYTCIDRSLSDPMINHSDEKSVGDRSINKNRIS